MKASEYLKNKYKKTKIVFGVLSLVSFIIFLIFLVLSFQNNEYSDLTRSVYFIPLIIFGFLALCLFAFFIMFLRTIKYEYKVNNHLFYVVYKLSYYYLVCDDVIVDKCLFNGFSDTILLYDIDGLHINVKMGAFYRMCFTVNGTVVKNKQSVNIPIAYSNNTNVSKSSDVASLTKDLNELASLRDREIISEKEFNELKEKLVKKSLNNK